MTFRAIILALDERPSVVKNAAIDEASKGPELPERTIFAMIPAR